MLSPHARVTVKLVLAAKLAEGVKVNVVKSGLEVKAPDTVGVTLYAASVVIVLIAVEKVTEIVVSSATLVAPSAGVVLVTIGAMALPPTAMLRDP